MPGKRNATKTSSSGRKRTQRKKSNHEGYGTDWARVDRTSDAQIAAQIRGNPDDIEFTDAMLAEARWIMPEKKIPISFRVDPEVFAFFKADGEGYQSRMNAVLRGYMRGQARARRKSRAK